MLGTASADPGRDFGGAGTHGTRRPANRPRFRNPPDSSSSGEAGRITPPRAPPERTEPNRPPGRLVRRKNRTPGDSPGSPGEKFVKNGKNQTVAKGIQFRHRPVRHGGVVGKQERHQKILRQPGADVPPRPIPFEGGNVAYTERKTFEYAGQEIPDMAIYWNVNTTLNAGTYTVELFLDDYRLASREFTFEK